MTPYAPSRVQAGAHDVRILRDGREVFPAMKTAIEQARDRVLLEMYWIAGDVVGRSFRDSLVQAAARGVRVRVMIDGFGCLALPRDFWRELRRNGGDVETFRPILSGVDRSFPRGILARDHRKLLVVDSRETFVGGLNLTQHWLPVEEGGGGWRDTAVQVKSEELGAHVAELFRATWDRSRGRHDASHVQPKSVWRASDGKVGVIANMPENRRRRRIRQAYLWAIRHASESVDITCAYFAPRRLFVRALSSAVARGVRVRVLLPQKSDVAIADLLARPWVRFLDRLGVEMYGFAAGTLHAKTAVVDRRLVTVGSHNLDALSWAYNLECNVVVDDEDVGRDATALFEDDLTRSQRLRPSRSDVLDRVSARLARAAERIYDL